MFIKLRIMKDEKKQFVGFLDMKHVQLFAWDEGLQLTIIWISGVIENYRVRETPEEIMQLIKEASKS